MEVTMWWFIASAVAGTLFPCGSQDILTKTAEHGALAHYEQACLDEVAEHDGPYQAAASRLLLADAGKRGNRVRWARLAERHLAHVDGSDASLNVAYARFLFASHRTEEVIAFAERALRHAPDWADPVQALSLHRLRTSAALSRWTETTVGMERVHRFAVSWLDAARAVGLDEPMAEQLCRTSGPEAHCDPADVVASR
jgi:hypothetical protein